MLYLIYKNHYNFLLRIKASVHHNCLHKKIGLRVDVFFTSMDFNFNKKSEALAVINLLVGQWLCWLNDWEGEPLTEKKKKKLEKTTTVICVEGSSCTYGGQPIKIEWPGGKRA